MYHNALLILMRSLLVMGLESLSSFRSLSTVDRCICHVYAAPMIPKLVKFSKQQLSALLSLSKKTGLSVSEHIRRAVDDYLKGK